MPPVIQPSFAYGEISPTLFSRVDLAKARMGLETCLNFFVDYRGGVSNRPGTKFIGSARDSVNPVRLIPFQFSTVQGYMLEFGQQYIRVIMNGGYVLEAAKIITGITRANPATVTAASHGFATGDIVYITGVLGMTQVNGRFFTVTTIDANIFTLTDMFGNAVNSSAYTAYSSGGTAARVYTIMTPYAGADIFALDYTQSADVMTIVHPSYAPRELTRTGHTAWTLNLITFAAAIAAPTALSVISSSNTSAVSLYNYFVTAVDANGDESLPSVPVSTSAFNVFNTIKWAPVAGAVYYNVYRAPAVNSGGVLGIGTIGIGGVAPGLIGIANGSTFVDSNFQADYSITPPVHKNPFAFSAITSVLLTNNGTGYTTPPTATISDPTGNGAVLSVLWDSVAHVVIDVIVANGGSGYISPTVVFSGGGGSGAAATASVGPGTGVYPGTLNYFQQRLVYAGSNNNPQTFWTSKIGAFKNMDISTPSRSDDAITATLISSQVNAIRSLVAMPGGLLALTAYGAWNITGGQGNALTPLNFIAQAQSYTGAAATKPLVINNDVLYVQDKGSHIQDLSYDYYSTSYKTVDLSLLSDHMFFGYTIPQWTWAEAPFKLIWAVRSDGYLISMTFVKEQEIFGCARHNTDGAFVSIASISEGNENAVYFVVNRTVNGHAIRYIERLASRNFSSNVINGWFLDAALQYSGSAVATVTGLEHLEGKTVTALADGVVVSGLVVTNATVTLPAPAALIVVGLPYTQQCRTLYLDVQGANPTVQDRRKKISSITLRVVESRGLKSGPDFSTLVASKVSTTPVASSPQGTWVNGLFTGDDRNIAAPWWTVFGQACWQQDFPYPATVTGVILGAGIGDA